LDWLKILDFNIKSKSIFNFIVIVSLLISAIFPGILIVMIYEDYLIRNLDFRILISISILISLLIFIFNVSNYYHSSSEKKYIVGIDIVNKFFKDKFINNENILDRTIERFDSYVSKSYGLLLIKGGIYNIIIVYAPLISNYNKTFKDYLLGFLIMQSMYLLYFWISYFYRKYKNNENKTKKHS